jgi:predicted dehydrogenase
LHHERALGRNRLQILSDPQGVPLPVSPPRPRHAIVGLGSRAQMYVRALADTHAEHNELAAFCDPNRTRMQVHNRALQEFGRTAVPTYAPAEFTTMLERERVDRVVVTTVDRTHDDYIVAALRAGCDVVTEKPMTTDAERCRRILDAQAETGRPSTTATTRCTPRSGR